MLRINLPVLAVLSLALLGFALGQQLGHDERCQVIEGNGVRVDQCDGTKLLACKDGRCQCADPANQIFTYRYEVISSRGKRSPGKKGGGFKKIAVGAVAGAATYHVASQATKGFGGRSTEAPQKYRKVYSCYSRVGGSCSLNYNNVETVDGTTSSTTVAPAVTTVASNETTTVAVTDNSTSTTTTTAAPIAAAQTAKLDVSKIPRCVQYATCKFAKPSGNSSSGFLQKVDFDPRVGVCECDSGYKSTTKDLCVKENGAGRTVGASLAVILAALVVNKMFV